jgi:hypothetical protein
LIQLLNYERIFAQGIRNLPLNFRETPDKNGEIVFVRLLRVDEADDRHIWFYPTTLALHPKAGQPVVVEATKEVRLRAWNRPELETLLPNNGFEITELYGDMTGGDYDSVGSSDLVLSAVKNGK